MANHAWAGQKTLRALLQCTFFDVLVKDCPTCNSMKRKRTDSPTSQQRDSEKKCHNFFCVDCEMGGLCKETFQEGGDHDDHRKIQVRKVTRENVLRVNDLVNQQFMTSQHAEQIQKYQNNGKDHFKFERTSSNPKAPLCTRLRICAACKLPISGSSYSNHSTSTVCSMKCFLDHALMEFFDSHFPAIDSLEGVQDRTAANGAGKGKGKAKA